MGLLALAQGHLSTMGQAVSVLAALCILGVFAGYLLRHDPRDVVKPAAPADAPLVNT